MKVVRKLLFLLLAACNTATLKYPPEAGDTGVEEPDAGVYPFPTTSKAHVIVEPSDNGNAVVAAINGAQTSVHMTMYLLSNNSVMNALIAKHKAGVDVKVILNKNFPDPGMDNGPELNQLQAAGVPVVWAPAAFTYTHAKCVVIDGKEAWIMTMNLTFTSPSSNREYLVVDDDPDDAAEADAIFAADFAATQATASRLVVANINARARLLQLIQYATQTLDVEGETLSDDGIVGSLVAAKKAGIAVRVVVSDQMYSSAMLQSIMQLKSAGVPIVKLTTPYVHAKAMVADGIVAYVGSENYTQNSLDSNREIGVFLTADVSIVASQIDADFKAGTAL